MNFSFEDAVHAPNGMILIIAIVAIPICIFTTILRIIGTRRTGRKMGWDDYFVIGALIGFLPYAISPIAAMVMAETLDDPLDIYVLATIHVLWFIIFFFMENFLCNPVSLWWDLTGEQEGWCIDGITFLVAEEGINSSLDFAKIMTRNHVKSKLAFIFLIGGLSGVIGFIKIGLVYDAENNAGPSSSPMENDVNAFWNILQMATSMLMLPADAIWHRLKSSTQYLVSRTRLPYLTVQESAGSGTKSHRKDPNHRYGGSGGRERKQEHRGCLVGLPPSDNSSEAQQAFYIGGDEADLTWSQFDKVQNIKLDVYKSRARADSRNADKSSGADSFSQVAELV
ncbi:hypothetical protein V8F33_006294 [Rhypophila sp. PSN 637]